MLTVESAGHRFCDRVTRRRALQVGGLATLGLGLPDLLWNEAQAQASRTLAASGSLTASASLPAFGRAKRVILLFMWGGPAHQDTWDLKPDGPVELRGEFRPIATSVPGIHISEHFPLIARHAEKLAIIRSVGQEDNNHSTGAHAGLTGRRHERQAENFGARDSDFPHYGSVLSKLAPGRGGMPTFVALPEVIHTTNGTITPGQFGGIIGRKYDPFQVREHPDEPGFSIDALRLPEGVTNPRMQSRRALLRQIDDLAKLRDRSQSAAAMDDYYRQALQMVLSPEARRAFDIASVPEAERWRYGWHTFGQSVLLARRLIEAGVKLVTVYWHREVKTIDTSWDTHSRNFTELKGRLMPSVDRPIAALLEDLQQKGLLDETLVVWNSEFGRTPKINKNAGRDHWGPCNSVVMAGGGVPGGQVFGESDKAAAYPVRDKVTQDDIAATIYHLLGFPPETPVYDRTGRPHHVALGKPIEKLLGAGCRPQSAARPPAVVRLPGVVRPDKSPFHQMLIQRGRRFLCCELGNPAAATDWKLAGWSEPMAGLLSRNVENSLREFGTRGASPLHWRRCEQPPATIEYLEHFYNHFNYGWCAFHLAAPAGIDGLKLSLAGREIPIPTKLAESSAQRIWQIPFPEGLIPSISRFELQVASPPDWQVSDFAVLGDAIHQRFLQILVQT